MCVCVPLVLNWSRSQGINRADGLVTGSTRAITQQHFCHSLPLTTHFLTRLRPPVVLEGFRLMNSARFLNALSRSHTHMEALTFEWVFVKSAPLHVCLSEDGGDFSDNGVMTPIDSICGSEGRWNKGPGVHQQTSD